MLEIHHSNRLEVLLDHLVEVLDQPLADPFGEEFLVAQNQGMARWLAQGLAQQSGVAANLRFPLPARLVWDLLGCWFADLPPQSEWDKDRLVWRVFARLPALIADPAFAEPARYLVGEPQELKTYQLARRVADLFDQYLVYRPDVVLEWEQGPAPAHDHWQARLWRQLAAEIETPHRAALFSRLDRALTDGVAPHSPLPERVLVFAPTALPPIYCRVLTGLAGLIPVHLFVLNPCQEYWADIVDEGRRARRRARALLTGTPDSSALLDLGNPLLASWGHGGMGFQDQLLDMGGDWLPDFREPDPASLLGLIQGDILDLRDRRRADPADRTPLDPADDSIQVQACHGRHREVQVLHDRLLRFFATLPGLKPREVICMAPDIDSYAAHIDAVFGAAPAQQRIPWSIADRRLSAEQPILGAVAELLGLPHSRLGAAQVLAWLEVPAIARRFGIDADALERVHTWVTETGVRWGLDATMRADLELPGEDANSWAFGLRRLFLGLALPPGDSLYHGVLPYPDLEGPETVALGGLQEFIDALGRWRSALAQSYLLADWAGLVNRLLGDLFDPDEDEAQLLQPPARRAGPARPEWGRRRPDGAGRARYPACRGGRRAGCRRPRPALPDRPGHLLQHGPHAQHPGAGPVSARHERDRLPARPAPAELRPDGRRPASRRPRPPGGRPAPVPGGPAVRPGAFLLLLCRQRPARQRGADPLGAGGRVAGLLPRRLLLHRRRRPDGAAAGAPPAPALLPALFRRRGRAPVELPRRLVSGRPCRSRGRGGVLCRAGAHAGRGAGAGCGRPPARVGTR
ncbi:exodeoxyribonuclease V subunit gamma [uncultured Thiodictyon sp.]|uniref:exodeoxyribonuclease V subunit gamma n=1 Tax=uncultured Thiodictyon sp. TaxID=1846217 RepID=UPI0034247449